MHDGGDLKDDWHQSSSLASWRHSSLMAGQNLFLSRTGGFEHQMAPWWHTPCILHDRNDQIMQQTEEDDRMINDAYV